MKTNSGGDMKQDALQALETIEKSWMEDRVRSDLLPAIQSLRQILWNWTHNHE